MFETITTRNERATRYSRHVQRERTRHRMVFIQWAALLSSVAWIVTLGALLWAA